MARTPGRSPSSPPTAWGSPGPRDSRELIISIGKTGEGDRVYRASLLGAPRLTLLLREARATDLSRDGRWLYVSRTTVQPKKLADRLVPVTDGPAEFARESVDGRSIYFALRQESEGLWQQPVSGGPPRQVVDQLYRRNLFVPARDVVYYVARPQADSFPSLYFRNAATGRRDAPQSLRPRYSGAST